MKELKDIRSLRGLRHMNQDEQMLIPSGYCVQNEIEGLFPCDPKPLVSKKAADVLQSSLIDGFEAALDQGMQPADALAVVLCWVSSEMVRLHSEQTSGS